MNIKDLVEILANASTALSFLVIIISLVYVIRSNNQVAKSMRVTALQQVLSEMNEIRRIRGADPELEKSLFDSRRNWDDLTIKKHLIAVQLANILEWAYLARRDGLLSQAEWTSWAKTWKDVILSSVSLKSTFQEEVWTFARNPEMAAALKAIFEESGTIEDPRKNVCGWRQFLGE